MIRFAGRVRVVTAFVLLAATSPAALAQDVSEDHLKAARAAIAAVGATDSFDNILPNLAERLKANLIQSSPNYQDLITSTIDTKALELAGRRSDLEREAATIYAKTFTIDQLNAIAAFYQSEAGKKLLNDGPIASREMLKAADIWAAGVSRDLSAEATKALQATLAPPANAAAGTAPAPAPTPAP
jgi:hypothetical protein